MYERELNESYMKAYIKTAKLYRNLNIPTELRTLRTNLVLQVATFASG